MCIGNPCRGVPALRFATPSCVYTGGRFGKANAPDARRGRARIKRATPGGNAMKHVLGGLALTLAAIHAPFAQAQTYPERPIKLLVPLAAASAVDVVARVVGEKMGNALGQRLYVENMPGAAGRIGMRAAAHAAP